MSGLLNALWRPLRAALVWPMIGLIRLYRLVLSPLIGQQCRFDPTCSRYTEEAIRRHGPFWGVWMGLTRISRCHPWGGMGYDPVPERPRLWPAPCRCPDPAPQPEADSAPEASADTREPAGKGAETGAETDPGSGAAQPSRPPP